MADRVNQIGPVQRVEVKGLHPLVHEIDHLLGGDRGGHEMARRRIIVEALESAREPGRTAAPVLTAKPATWRKLWIGTMPGVIGTQMPAARARSRKRR